MNTDNLKNLNQFTGTENYYKNPFGILYTDGVQYLAEHAEAYWLIDAIASHQPAARKYRDLIDFQLWTLTVKADHTATLACYRDSGEKPKITQEIEWTDFPLPEIKLYLENGVLLLPYER